MRRGDKMNFLEEKILKDGVESLERQRTEEHQKNKEDFEPK